MKPKVFIPFRDESSSDFDRNNVAIAGQPLWAHALLRLTAFQVFVDTDCDAIIEQIRSDGRFAHVHADRRSAAMSQKGVSVNDLIHDFLDRYRIGHEPICQMHVTTPLLEVETLLSAYKDVEFASPYDSVVGCTEIQKRMWREDHDIYIPLNHNPLRLTSSKWLSPVLLENSSFYFFEADTFRKVNNRIGFRPHFYRVPFPESLEITTEEEARLVNCLLQSGFVSNPAG